MSLVLRMIQGEVARRLRGQFDRMEERPLGPAEPPIPVRPALYEESQLGRIQVCGFGSSVAEQKAVLDATLVPSTPPRVATLKNVEVLGGRIYSEGRQYCVSAERPYLHALAWTPEFDVVTVCNSMPGLKHFGHWLRDDCAARELPGRGIARSLRRPPWADCPLYEAAFEQDWTEACVFRARELDVVTDLGFSRDKADRLHRLRARLRANHPGAASSGADPLSVWQGPPLDGPTDRVVYLRRGGGEPRNMEREDELVASLAAVGVVILETERGSEQLVAGIRDARIVISIEGSQLTHALFGLMGGGGLVVLQPPGRFYNPHHEWARLLGMRYGIVVGESCGDGYTIAADEVLAMTDRVNDAIDREPVG